MVDFEKYIYETFPFLSYAKVVFLSSVNLKRIYTLFPVLDTTYANYFKRINTSLLNEVIQNAYLITPPKLYNKAIVKIYYATQVSCGPPLIAIFCNDPEHMHFSYERFIKNEIRKAFDFSGVPIQLSVRKRD